MTRRTRHTRRIRGQAGRGNTAVPPSVGLSVDAAVGAGGGRAVGTAADRSGDGGATGTAGAVGDSKPARPRMAPPRGRPGPGGGQAPHTEPPSMWQGTTVQVCGLWPFVAGSGTPAVGAPLGQHLHTGATVCGDPISWFSRAHLISNPSMFVLGKPGLGKSTLVLRMLVYLAAIGVKPLVLGDLKPDYAAAVGRLGGQVITLGRGVGGINVLDPGAMGAAARRIGGQDGLALRAEAHGRALTIVAALVTLVRGRPVDDHEQAVLSACLHSLTDAHRDETGWVPTLPDLVRVLDQGTDRVRAVTLDRGDDQRYRAAVDPLHRSLLGLLDGPLGDTFAAETTTHIDIEAPAVVVDISRIGESDAQLTAAAMLAAWSDGLGCVAAAHALADAGKAERRWYFTILDELWRPLRASGGLVDRIDAMTRLNRTWGVGQAMITHTLKDLESVGTATDRAKARGFVERSGMVACLGLPRAELGDLDQIVGLSRREVEMITSWSSPVGWGGAGDGTEPPPGLGHALVKVGGRPGVPIRTAITATEADLHNTNARWEPTHPTPDTAAGTAAGTASGTASGPATGAGGNGAVAAPGGMAADVADMIAGAAW